LSTEDGYIYIYYGDLSRTSIADGTGVFDFFDDFEDTDFVKGGWDYYIDGNNQTKANTTLIDGDRYLWLEAWGGATDTYVQSNTSFLAPDGDFSYTLIWNEYVNHSTWGKSGFHENYTAIGYPDYSYVRPYGSEDYIFYTDDDSEVIDDILQPQSGSFPIDVTYQLWLEEDDRMVLYNQSCWTITSGIWDVTTSTEDMRVFFDAPTYDRYINYIALWNRTDSDWSYIKHDDWYDAEDIFVHEYEQLYTDVMFVIDSAAKSRLLVTQVFPDYTTLEDVADDIIDEMNAFVDDMDIDDSLKPIFYCDTDSSDWVIEDTEPYPPLSR
jgi:hypothetical protein